MITFENKVIDNLKGPEGQKFDYAGFALLTLNSPLRSGMTVDDIKQRMALMDKFKIEPGATLELTAKELTLLQFCVKNMSWGIVHESIPAFDDYIARIKDVEVKN